MFDWRLLYRVARTSPYPWLSSASEFQSETSLCIYVVQNCVSCDEKNRAPSQIDSGVVLVLDLETDVFFSILLIVLMHLSKIEGYDR